MKASDDAKRVGWRFAQVLEVVAEQSEISLSLTPEQRDLIDETFDEIIRAEVIFPGPSLYADP